MRRKGWILIPICVAVLFIIILKTVFLIGYVPSASMEPTLKERSIVFGMRIFSDLQVGDVIVFKKDEKLLVKRIAAKGGESIRVDGIKYDIPRGEYFVLGDNLKESFDSRYWTNPFVKESEIIAKLFI